jgi:hypothetical protein
MILGVSFPALCLTVFELWSKFNHRMDEQYTTYIREKGSEIKIPLTDSQSMEAQKDHDFSMKVIQTGIMAIGTIVCVLGIIADNGKTVVVCTGMLLVLIGFYIGKNRFNHSSKK